MRSRALTLTGWITVVATLFLMLTGSAALNGRTPITAISPTENDRTLTVIAHRSYHTYYEHQQHGADGLAFQLVNGFAKTHDYKLNLILADHIDDIYDALDSGVADVGLIGRPLSLSRQESYPQSAPYTHITTQLVYRHTTGTPETFAELAGKTIYVRDNEQYREKQQFIQAHYPDINWQFSSKSPEELVGLVNSGAIEYTLVDSHEYITLRALYTRTRVAFPIYYPEPLTLALSSQAQSNIGGVLNDYLSVSKENGSLKQLLERYYGHAKDSNPRGARTFFTRVNQRLPKYQDLIKQTAAKHDLDWRLLAAVAYQESHWDPRAQSPTGVRGMMMLTLETAKTLNVSNRLDVNQSLDGGALYLKQLMARLPDSIQQPDRTWFALASYNVGFGHILDARDITEFHGGDPDRWVDVKKYLPLLEKEEWHQYTRYGKARGSEPVSYVQNIRHFKDLLEWRFPLKETTPIEHERIASIRPLNQVLEDVRTKELDPSLQPVRLSNLIDENGVQQSL